MPFRLVQMSCRNCGASVHLDPTLKLAKCDFCGADMVLQRELDDAPSERMDYIYQDALSKDDFEKAIRQFLFEAVNCPDDTYDSLHREVFHLTYVPFYTLTASWEGTWSADAGYFYKVQKARLVNGSDGRKETQYYEVTETRWEPVSGAASGIHSFNVAAAKSIFQGPLAKKIAEMYGAIPVARRIRYMPEYLQGSARMPLDVTEEAADAAVAPLLKDAVLAQCRAMVPGDTQRGLSVQWTGTTTTTRSMVPFWMLGYQYRGKHYLVYMDAVQGQIAGTRPVSTKRVLYTLSLVIIPILLLIKLIIDANAGEGDSKAAPTIGYLLLTATLPPLYRGMLAMRKKRLLSMTEQQREVALVNMRLAERRWVVSLISASLFFGVTHLSGYSPLAYLTKIVTNRAFIPAESAGSQTEMDSSQSSRGGPFDHPSNWQHFEREREG